MEYVKARFYLIALLLVSSMFFPSAQQAFADSNVTVANGQTLTILNGQTLSITGILSIDIGGKLIVEEGATINIDGTDSDNGIVNQGEIEQHGTINFLNPLALFFLNNGVWTLICGTINNGGTAPQGIQIEVGYCAVEEIILDIPGGVIPAGTTYTVDDQGGKTVVLKKDLIVFGTLVNDGFLSNRALITIKTGSLIDLSNGGSIENVCGNYQSKGISGSGQVSPNNVSTLICYPSTAVIDNYSTQEDTPISISSANGVLSNDTPGNNNDIPGNNSTLSSFLKTSTTKGSIILNIDGSFQYTPNPNSQGPDSFSYNVKDGNGGLSNIATVHITVTPTPDPPVANNDSATTPEDTPISISVLSNDFDLDGDILSIASVTNGAHGVTTISGTSVIYSPNLNYNGPDSFTYTISDGNGGTATATVSVTVTPVNDPPVANDDSASTLEDTPVTIDVLDNDTDVSDDILEITLVQNPSNNGGTVTIDTKSTPITDDDEVEYSPNLNYNGPDSFTYTISDGNGGTATATVSVTVTPVNDPPVANDDSASTLEDTPVTIDVLDNDSSPDGNIISITDVSTASNGFVTNNGDTVTYEPNQHFVGSDSFTYTISDDNDSDSATVTITITNTNDSPVISILSPSDDSVFLIGESVDFAGSANDEEDGILTLEWFSSKDGLIGTGNSFSVSNLSEGVHVISPTTIDSQGSVTTESVTITIQVDLENELFCDDLTISELVEKANKGKYNLIDNRGNPSATLEGTDDADLILAGNFGDLIKAKGGNDCVIGGAGNDEIRGQEGNDEIFGLGGDDVLRGNNGNDLLDGGNGGDDLAGGEGNDKLNGGAEQDNLAGGSGNDELIGGEGNDELIGGEGNDELIGGPGTDILNGGAGNDDIKGGDGDDTITGGAGNDKLDGGAEDDIINGGAGNDDIKGGDGDDDLKGQADEDKIEGGNGNDTIAGGAGNDKLEGNDGNDTIAGGAGNDDIKGGDGDDVILGGLDDDKIDGGKGNDLLRGNDGNDDIKGGDGDDDLKGQKGDDTLKGEKGIDSLNGGADNDSCYEDNDDTLLNCEILKSNDKHDDDKHDDDKHDDDKHDDK